MNFAKFAGSTLLLLIFCQAASSDEVKPTPAATAAEIFSRKISIAARNTSLINVLTDVARKADVPLKLDVEALQREDLDLNRLQDVSITDTELSTVLWVILGSQQPFRIQAHLQFSGGMVFVSTQKANNQRIRQALPEWLQTVYDDRKLSVTLDDEMQVISLTSYDVLTDAMMAQLPSLIMLRVLKLHGLSRCTEAGLAPLGQLRALEDFTLVRGASDGSDSRLSDAVLRSIAPVKSLRRLDLHESGITDAGLRHLDDSAQLTTLRLYQEGRLTDAALTSIAKHKQLTSMDLTSHVGTPLGRMRFSRDATSLLTALDALEHLNLTGHEYSIEMLQFPRLKSLSLSGGDFDAPLAIKIAGCRELKCLNLSFFQVTDDAFGQLRGHPNLTELKLRCRSVSDRAMSALPSLTQLSKVHLWTYGLTDQALADFAQIKSLTSLSLNWQANQFSPEGLKQLSQLPHLQTLELRIIPQSGGMSGTKLKPQDNSRPVSIVLPRPLGDEVLDAVRPLAINLKVLSEALPRTRIISAMDEFNPHDK